MTLEEEVAKIMEDAIATATTALEGARGESAGSLTADALEILRAAERGHREAILRLAREIGQF
jgi:hypothetical protein